MLLLYKGKCEKRFFSIALMFDRFSISKQRMWKEIWDIFHFHAFQVLSWYIGKMFLIWRLKNSISGNKRNLFRVGAFCFWSSECSLLKYKKFFKREAGKFYFPQYKKFFQSGFFRKTFMKLWALIRKSSPGIPVHNYYLGKDKSVSIGKTNQFQFLFLALLQWYFCTYYTSNQIQIGKFRINNEFLSIAFPVLIADFTVRSLSWLFMLVDVIFCPWKTKNGKW